MNPPRKPPYAATASTSPRISEPPSSARRATSHASTRPENIITLPSSKGGVTILKNLNHNTNG